MVNGKRVTCGTNLPEDMLTIWNTFKAEHRNIVYDRKLTEGASQCLAEACTGLATCYLNNIVENFEGHLMKFLMYKLQHTFMVSPNGF
jgi:hypothetical protein